MKTLRLSLALLFTGAWLQTAHAQTDPPFEGLRYKSFSATFDRDYFTPTGQTNGVFFYLAYKVNCRNVIEGGTNAYRHIKLKGYWDPSNGNYTELSPAVEVTNRFAYGPDGVVGALIEDGLKPYLHGQNLTSYGTNVPSGCEFQLPFQPFLGKGDVNGLKNVSSEMALVIAGDPAFTNDVVVKFSITATDKDTGLAIPDSAITVAGESVTNGVAWQSYREHTTNDVTATITGHANWTAELSAGIYRLTLEGEGFLYLDVDTNSPPNTNSFVTNLLASAPSSAAAQANQSATNTNAVPPTYFIFGAGAVVLTPPNTNRLETLVGARVTLIGKLPAADEGAVFTNFQWTVGGTTVSNFFVGTTLMTNTSGTIETQHVGQAVADYPKTNQSVTFAWWKPGKAVVKFNCDINGKAATAQCEVTVIKPPASIKKHSDGENIPDFGGPVAIGNVFTEDSGGSALLKLGRAMQNNLGVLFSIEKDENYWQFGWIQIINSSTRTRYRDQAVYTIDGLDIPRTNRTTSASGLDKAARLPTDSQYFDDSPGEPFNSNLQGGDGGNLV